MISSTHTDLFLESFYELLKAEGKFVDKYAIKELIDSFSQRDVAIQEYCDTIGLKMIKLYIPSHESIRELATPYILNDVLILEYKSNSYYIFHPVQGFITAAADELSEHCPGDSLEIYKFEKTPAFSRRKGPASSTNTWSFYSIYFAKYKRYYIQIFFGMFLGTILQMLPPFLTRILIDKGVGSKDITFMNLILWGLVAIQVGKVVSQALRDWITFYIGNRVSFSLLSDFVHRVMTAQVAFIEQFSVGDLLQRINDNKRIENFLANTLINTIFMVFNLFIFAFILAYYHVNLFLIFTIGSITYLSWSFYFLALRKRLDKSMFDQGSSNQTQLIQILEGKQEIKLQGDEKERRLAWEKNQLLLYKSNARLKKIDILQGSGATLINELKNVFVLYYCATMVMNNELTLGMMLAIQYILGQANQPIYKAAKVAMEAQSASLSLKRLSEIQDFGIEAEFKNASLKMLPPDHSISFDYVSYKYPKSINYSLRNIKLIIPPKKITGIIGTSGSGKTTVLKLLIKFYQPSEGNIFLGGSNLKHYNARWWRSKVGVILQDSYLYQDTILNNITGLGKVVDMSRVINAVTLANIRDEIEKYPGGYFQQIGPSGVRMSPGQKQRILIARLIYKDPEFVFLDEATNALDAINETIVLKNLFEFFKEKTVIMVTHRLNTIKEVDNLVVMDMGRVVEIGCPDELIKKDGQFSKMYKDSNLLSPSYPESN